MQKQSNVDVVVVVVVVIIIVIAIVIELQFIWPKQMRGRQTLENFALHIITSFNDTKPNYSKQIECISFRSNRFEAINYLVQSRNKLNLLEWKTLKTTTATTTITKTAVHYQMKMHLLIISILPSWINSKRASRPLFNIQIYN